MARAAIRRLTGPSEFRQVLAARLEALAAQWGIPRTARENAERQRAILAGEPVGLSSRQIFGVLYELGDPSMDRYGWKGDRYRMDWILTADDELVPAADPAAKARPEPGPRSGRARATGPLKGTP